MTVCSAVYRTVGDSGPDLYCELENIDITSKSISLTLRYETGGKLSLPAVVDDATAGMFHFVWGPADLVEGRHRAELVIVDGTTIKRLPTKQTLLLIVRPQA